MKHMRHSEFKALQKAVRTVKNSGAFDEEYYLSQTKASGIKQSNPIKHYLLHGWKLGLQPHPCFDTKYYLIKNTDIHTAGMNPFMHFILYGYKEHRYTSEDFYLPDYRERHPEVDALDINPLKHFTNLYGRKKTNILKATAQEIDSFSEALELAQDTVAPNTKRVNQVDSLIATDSMNNSRIVGRIGNVETSRTAGGAANLNTSEDQLEIAERHIKPELKNNTPVLAEVNRRLLTSRSSDTYEIRIENLSSTGITGWAVNRALPGEIFEFDVLINDTPLIKIRNNIARADLVRHKKSSGRGGFNLTFPKGVFDHGENVITIIQPCGQVFKCGSVQVKKEDEVNNPPLISNGNSVSIIVPIYNAIDDVKICISRLKKYTSPKVLVILINDASSDPEIKKFLDSNDFPENYIIRHNDENLGFTKTVNKGIALAGGDDVVLLNSDARVTPRWLEGMQRALKSDYRIATVTAMSDRAGAFSAPYIGNENDLPIGVTEIDYSRAFRRRARGLYPSVPTGNGFCMYIRRTCIEAIGTLDEVAFPRGYGEENDFCMRARSLGWLNVIDDRTYVFHDRSKSFGSEKQQLITSGRKVIDRRYPDYKHAIGVFTNSPALAVARFSAKQALADCQQGEAVRPRALFVIATTTGGTPQTNRDLMLALYNTWEPWLLHCDSNTLSLYRIYPDNQDVLVHTHRLTEPVDPIHHISYEYDRVVANWLEKFDFENVHIRHLAWHSLSLPKIAKTSGARVIYSFHDYYAICPTVKLLDADGFFCGGTCSKSKASADCSNTLWGSELPYLKDKWIYKWRDKFEEAISYADEFVTTSIHAKNTIVSIFKTLSAREFNVVPHGRDFTTLTAPSNIESRPSKIKILVPGNIDRAKGGGYILDLINHDSNALLEFHILGTVSEDFQSEIDNASSAQIICHGPYKRDEFNTHVNNIAPHVGAVFSIWDETWCHTLTEIWASGLPALVLDYPTIGGRVRNAKAGWVLDRKNTAHAFTVISKFVLNDHTQKNKAVRKWQETEGVFRDLRWMASQYHHIYTSERKIPINGANKTIAIVSPSNKTQTAAPGSTHIRIWENTRNNAEGDPTFCRVTPDQLVAGVKLGEITQAIIQRNALSKAHYSQLIASIKSGKFKFTFEIDDNLLAVPESIDTDGEYKSYQETLKLIIEGADSVTTSTEPLAEVLSKLNHKVLVVPNKISGNLWRKPVSRTLSGGFTAVYFGTKSHKEDYELILPSLNDVASRFSDFRLLVIGVLDENYPAPNWVEILQVPPPKRNYISFVPWLKEVTKHTLLGLAPLKDTEFNQYKSNLKALEYAALGLPVLASKGIVYDGIADEAPAISTVNNSRESWTEALIEMVTNSNALSKKGEDNKKWVQSNYMSLGNIPGYFEQLTC